MSILIKNAIIFDPDKEYHLQKRSILIEKGKIAEIATNISTSSARIIESKNLHCSIGWMDIGTHLGEPGFEHRETIDSLAEAASCGGYTALAPFPTTQPIIQSASDILFLKNRFSTKLQDVYPIAALTKDRKGEDLTEMMDLIENGAIAFCDGLSSIQSGGQMMRSLQYLKGKTALAIDFPYNKELAHGGQIHEGKTSVMLGLPGIAQMVETIVVKRDIDLAKYCETSVLLHGISCEESILHIHEAQRSQLQIKATAPYLNLILDETDLEGFDSNLKVLPPLRSKSDRKELIKAIRKGTIQAIVTNHCPLEEELKQLEFTYANFGATGLETCYAALNTYLGKKKMMQLLPAMSVGPRNIFGIPIPGIAIGEKAEVTLFDPEIKWKYDQPTSLSRNNPFIQKELTGKVIGVVNGSKSYIN